MCEKGRAANIESSPILDNFRINTAYQSKKLFGSVGRKCLKAVTIQYLRMGGGRRCRLTRLMRIFSSRIREERRRRHRTWLLFQK